MFTIDHSTHSARRGLLGLAVGTLVLTAACARSVEAQTTAGRFTEMGLMITGGPQRALGDWSASQGEFSLGLNVVHLDDHHYTGGALSGTYTWDDNLDFFALVARVDFGMGEGEFEGGDPLWFRTGYWSLMAGYGSGTLWDLAYIERFGQEDRVEIDVSGVPLGAAVGFRRIGRLALAIEATVGAILVLSETAYEPEGDAPSVIPTIGIKVGFGFDSFTYAR